jgi:hypothetical protein
MILSHENPFVRTPPHIRGAVRFGPRFLDSSPLELR